MQENENDVNQGLKKFIGVYNVNHVDVANNLSTAIKDGIVDPIEVHLALKKMEKVQEEFKKDKETQELIVEAVQKHLSGNAKSVTMHNAQMSIAATYTWYDYSECNDIYYQQLQKIKTEIDELIKQREAYLKTLIPATSSLKLFKHTEVIEQLPTIEWVDCGEEVSINYPIKYQKTGVKTTFKK
jgi:hypothetical protein